MSEDVGKRVEPGDTMIDLAHGVIYEHQEEPAFVTWDEAMDKVVANLSAVVTQEREKHKEEIAKALLTALRVFLKDKDNTGLTNCLRIWHEARDYECCAHSEGQACCIDELLGSTEPSA